MTPLQDLARARFCVYCGAEFGKRGVKEDLGVYYQHGDNPEVALFLPWADMLRDPGGCLDRLFEWCEAVHCRQEGKPI